LTKEPPRTSTAMKNFIKEQPIKKSNEVAYEVE